MAETTVLPSNFKFERDDRLDIADWHQFVKTLKEIIDVEYVDVSYKDDSKVKYNDENDPETIVIKLSSDTGISVREACDFVRQISNFSPDELDVINSGENFSIIRLWWD